MCPIACLLPSAPKMTHGPPPETGIADGARLLVPLKSKNALFAGLERIYREAMNCR